MASPSTNALAEVEQFSSDGSIDSELEWEVEEGIPQIEDPFLQKYFSGRTSLIEQEKKQRHDVLFKQTMSPIAHQAAKTLHHIRKRELRTIWGYEYFPTAASAKVNRSRSPRLDAAKLKSEDESINVFPGMMFTLARSRIAKTDIWKIIEKMPKGALLHAHLDAMIDVDWLVEQLLTEPGMCIMAPTKLGEKERGEDWGRSGGLQFRYFSEEDLKLAQSLHTHTGIWESYSPWVPVKVTEAAKTFPGGEVEFRKWLVSKCTITAEESLCHHHGLDAIWRKFQSTFPTIGWILFYEPIFRRALRRLLEQLAEDGIVYVDFRCAFAFEFRKEKETSDQYPGNFGRFFEVFGDEIEKFKESDYGKRVSWRGARMIWTVIRSFGNQAVVNAMKECIRIKKMYPHLVCGFDFVAQEDQGRTLKDLTPLIFWFRKQCVEAGVEIPFFFHAGECLGDGDSTDENLFDAILLGTRRIGHGYSLYKHPLLVDMVKEKKILVESCPISNELLRLSTSINSHTLPALLSRGVSVSLSNDDPAILGHGKNGLSHDFWQSFMAWENLGLEGLATMAENSLKWSAIEDQKSGQWITDIADGYMGKNTKADMLREWRGEFEKWCQWIIMEYPLEEDEDGEGI